MGDEPSNPDVISGHLQLGLSASYAWPFGDLDDLVEASDALEGLLEAAAAALPEPEPKLLGWRRAPTVSKLVRD